MSTSVISSIGISLVSRILTFGLNQLVTKDLPPALLGYTSRSELFLAIIQVIVLGYRKTSFRTNIISKPKLAYKTLNGAWRILFWGLIVTLILAFGLLYQEFSDPSIFSSDVLYNDYGFKGTKSDFVLFSRISLLFISAGTLFQISAEPFYILFGSIEKLNICFTIELLALICKLSFLFILAKFNLLVKYGPLFFGASTMIYGFFYSFLFISTFWIYYSYLKFPALVSTIPELNQIFAPNVIFSNFIGNTHTPFQIHSQDTSSEKITKEDHDNWKMTFQFHLLSIQQFILTYATSFVRSFSSRDSDTQAGVHFIVSNYGSMVARLIFRPIEQHAYNSFGKLESNPMSNSSQNIKVFSKAYIGIASFGFIISFFGYLYSPILLKILLGPRWVENSFVLNLVQTSMSLYCIYLFFMGINGISEAFVHATVSVSELSRLNIIIGVWSIFYLILVYFTWNLYEVHGIIMANIINMIIRIIVSFWFIFKNSPFLTSCKTILSPFINLYLLIPVVGSYIIFNSLDSFLLLGFHSPRLVHLPWTPFTSCFGCENDSARNIQFLFPRFTDLMKTASILAIGGICGGFSLVSLFYSLMVKK